MQSVYYSKSDKQRHLGNVDMWENLEIFLCWKEGFSTGSSSELCFLPRLPSEFRLSQKEC